MKHLVVAADMRKCFIFLTIFLLFGCAKEISMTSEEFRVVCDVGIAAVNLKMAESGYGSQGESRCTKIIDQGDAYIISGVGWYAHPTLHLSTHKDWTVTDKKMKSTPTFGDISGLDVVFN